MKWTETMIRREMEKLDKKTGLTGSKLPIVFSNCYSCLGAFHCDSDSKMWFSFSKKYYHSNEFSKEEALDVIRHEYAHYMNRIVYKGSGHDSTWRKCCSDVGAIATRLYSGLFNDYYIKKEQNTNILLEELKQFKVGSKIRHPVFGTGYVTAIYGRDVGMRLEVEFYSVGIKTLTAKWVNENC